MFNRKPPYSPAEVETQLKAISTIMAQREKSLQLSVVTRSDTKQQKYLEEVDRFMDQVEVAQKVLAFMQEAIEKYLEKKGSKHVRN